MALHTRQKEKHIKGFLLQEHKEETITVRGPLGKREQQKLKPGDISGDVEGKKAIQ